MELAQVECCKCFKIVLESNSLRSCLDVWPCWQCCFFIDFHSTF